jgi:hypothetical protein
MRLATPLTASLLLLGAPATAVPVVNNACTADATLPSWTIKDFKSNVTDSVGAGGVASFTLTNNLTGALDQLQCDLQVNYRCIFAGIPSDKNVTVHVAVRASWLTLLVDEEVKCPDSSS